MKAGDFRTLMTTYVPPESLVPLKEWCKDLQTYSIDWESVLSTTFTLTNSNNFKLIQFQYKLMMRISTCRYMRFKMNIVKDHPYCSKFNNRTIETLYHIFITNSKFLGFWLGRKNHGIGIYILYSLQGNLKNSH